MRRLLKNTRHWLIPLLTAFLLLVLALNTDSLAAVLKALFFSAMPIIAGLGLAFILNIPMRFFENKCFSFLEKSNHAWVRKLRRPLSLAVTLILSLGVIALTLCVIIPELVRTAEVLITNLPDYADAVISRIQAMLRSLNMPEETLNTLTVDWGLFIKKLLEYLQTPTVATAAQDITTGLINGIFGTFMAVVIAVYTLSSKKQVKSFFRRFFQAALPKRFLKPLFELFHLTDTAFSGFIRSQFLNAVILGVSTYAGMLIFGFPYPEAISVFLAITSLIPIVGQVIGAAVGALLILMTSFPKALFFLLFIIILQQVEGNIVYPRIVGKTLGVPGIIIVSAVVLGSGLYGIAGIMIGVPLSSLSYTLVKRFIQKRLAEEKAESSR